MLSSTQSCLLDAVWGRKSLLHTLHLCSLQMKLIFEFLGRTDWWCTNSGFFVAFFCILPRSFLLFSESVAFKASRDRERPSDQKEGLFISDLSLGVGCSLVVWSKMSSAYILWADEVVWLRALSSLSNEHYGQDAWCAETQMHWEAFDWWNMRSLNKGEKHVMEHHIE